MKIRLWPRRPIDVAIERAREHDIAETARFRELTPSPHADNYFRGLDEALDATLVGRPADLRAVVRGLANLERRVADLEEFRDFRHLYIDPNTTAEGIYLDKDDRPSA